MSELFSVILAFLTSLAATAEVNLKTEIHKERMEMKHKTLVTT